MGFQKQVNNQPGVAAEGDFADANIRANVLAGPGALVAAPSPRSPIVGHFAWGDQATGQAFSNYRGEATAKIGFVHRENNAIIVPFLAGDQMAIEAGLVMTLFDQGSFWAKFAGGANVGQKVFAKYSDGSVYSADAGTSTQVADFTGALANTGVLTVSAVASGAIGVGDVITGVGVPAGIAVTAQLSGTPGGVGTYQTSLLGTVIGAQQMFAHDSVETGFSVDSSANAGELAKISTWG